MQLLGATQNYHNFLYVPNIETELSNNCPVNPLSGSFVGGWQVVVVINFVPSITCKTMRLM